MERIVKLADIDAMTANYNEMKAAMDELKSGVLAYNSDDDYIYINGEKWKWAGLKFNGIIYADGTFASGFSIDDTPANFATGWTVVSSFIDDGNSIKATGPSGTQSVAASMLEGAIDFSKYNYLKVVANGTTYTVDMSAYSGIGYIGFVVSGASYSFFRVYVCTTQTPTSFDDQRAVEFTAMTYQSGYNNITKIWVE